MTNENKQWYQKELDKLLKMENYDSGEDIPRYLVPGYFCIKGELYTVFRAKAFNLGEGIRMIKHYDEDGNVLIKENYIKMLGNKLNEINSQRR